MDRHNHPSSRPFNLKQATGLDQIVHSPSCFISHKDFTAAEEKYAKDKEEFQQALLAFKAAQEKQTKNQKTFLAALASRKKMREGCRGCEKRKEHHAHSSQNS